MEVGMVRGYFLSTRVKDAIDLSLIRRIEGSGHWTLWLKLLSAYSQVLSLIVGRFLAIKFA